MKSLNVIHIITTIERGGAEIALLNLSKGQVKAGHQVTVIPLKGNPELKSEFESNGVRVDLAFLNIFNISTIFSISSISRKSDIVHAHLPRAEILTKLANLNRFIIITRHNAEPFRPEGSKIFSKILSRLVTIGRVRVIAISEAVKTYLISHREVSRHKEIAVVYYGFEAQYPNKGLHRKTALQQHKIRLGTIARLTRQKNISLLIEFTAWLNAFGYGAKTHIIGAGPLQQTLIDQTTSLGIEDSVTFVGRVNDVYPLLRDLDIFILTSDYEGFGLSLLEAMDAGVLVMAPNNSAIPEVLGSIHPGLYRSGDLSDLFYKFKVLTDNFSRYQEAMNQQEQRLNFFSVDRCIMAHNEIYKRILSR